MGGVKQDEQEPPQPSIAPAQPGDDAQARPPVRLPHLPVVDEGIYQVGPEFARGGIGRILEGYHRPLGRVVAIKELLEPSAEQEARFIREARITARLEHPAIVPVHDAGRWADKRPFYSMKLVSGRSLLERIGGCGTLAERLGLLHHVTAVAEAIAYAHSLKIINRDVKPANVIVGDFGETVVIDWGLAKELGVEEQRPEPGGQGAAAPQGQDRTVYGTVLGTPAYMAPEQAKGESVDERADVYALGALLYHLLAGSSPYAPTKQPEGLASDAGGTVTQSVQEPERKPSDPDTDLIQLVATRSAIPLTEREPGAPRDLVAIVEKAMARDPASRYPTAKEMAEDLRRFQTGQLVSARYYTRGARLLHWVHRNRRYVTLAAAMLTLLLGGGAVSIGTIIQARNLAQKKQREAETLRLIATEQRQLAEEQTKLVSAQRNDLVLAQARSALARDPTAALAWLKRYPASAGRWSELRGIALDALAAGVAEDVLLAESSAVTDVSLSPDGQLAATGGRDGSARLWRATRGLWRELHGHRGSVNWVLFSPDGAQLATGGEDGKVLLWSLGGPQDAPPQRLLPGESPVSCLAFSADGSLLAIGTADGATRIWDWRRGALKGRLHQAGAVQGVTFSADGRSVFAGSDARILHVFEVASGVDHPIALETRCWHPLLVPAGDEVVVSDREQLIVVSLTGQIRRRLRTDAEIFYFCLVSAHEVATTGRDGVVRIYDLLTGVKKASLLGNEGISALACHPGAPRLVSGDSRGTLRLWPLRPLPGKTLEAPYGSSAPSFSPSGQLLAMANRKQINVWNLATGDTRILAGPQGAVTHLDFAPGDKQLAARGEDGAVTLWTLADGSARTVARDATGYPSRWLPRVMFSASGEHLLYIQGDERIASLDRTYRVTCLFTGDPIRVLRRLPGERIAYTSGTSLRIGDLRTCASAVVLRADCSLQSLEISPDGQLAAVVGDDHKLMTLEISTARVRVLGSQADTGFALAFSTDGRTLATSRHDDSIQLWDLAAAAESKRLEGKDIFFVNTLAFTASNRFLVSSSDTGATRVWDLDSGIGALALGDTSKWGIRVSPDRGSFAAGFPGGARLLPAGLHGELPTEPAALREWLAHATTATIDVGRKLESPGSLARK
jgi:WD40 repeat protein/serine/threonine protein kinase